MFNNPYAYQASFGADPLEGLPSGAIVVYNFSEPTCFTEGDTTIYDLSGNGHDGTFYGTIGSGSDAGAKYLTFDSTDANIVFGNDSSFRDNWNPLNYNMYVGCHYYLATVPNSSGVIAGTWENDQFTGTQMGEWAMLLPQTTTQKTRVILDLQLSDGSSTQFIAESSAGIATPITGSRATFSFYAIQNNMKSYLNNTQVSSISTSSTKGFRYSNTDQAYNGHYVNLGNWGDNDLNFEGRLYKFVMYNRTLTTDELQDIDDWMNL